MIKKSMLKKWAFWGTFIPLLLPLASGISRALADGSPAIQIEKLRFFDWEAGASPQKIAKKTCYLQFTGFSHDRIFLSMRLSMLKASPASGSRNALTILKITATKVFQKDFSDALPIRLSEAWIETSTVTTLGLLKKSIDKDAHFVGGIPGNGLFHTLLRSMRKDGLIIGYHSETGPFARVFKVGVPPPHLFETLKICLTKSAAFFQTPNMVIPLFLSK